MNSDDRILTDSEVEGLMALAAAVAKHAPIIAAAVAAIADAQRNLGDLLDNPDAEPTP